MATITEHAIPSKERNRIGKNRRVNPKEMFLKAIEHKNRLIVNNCKSLAL
jgi:hypothetical protein